MDGGERGRDTCTKKRRRTKIRERERAQNQKEIRERFEVRGLRFEVRSEREREIVV